MPQNHIDPTIAQAPLPETIEEFTSQHRYHCLNVASFILFADNPKANTLITYIYRDAANYKQVAELILPGAITPAQLATIYRHLDEDDGFVPGQVGLEDLQLRFNDDWDDESDHPFHEFVRIELTLEERSLTVLTPADLANSFDGVSWDQAYRP